MARIEGVAGTTDSRTALTVRRVIAYVVLILLVIISLLPFYLLIINATRGKVQTGLQFYPGKALGGNFKTLLSENYKQTYGDFFRSFANSLIIAAFTTVLSVYFSALTAYAIHVYDFKLKKFMFTFILAIMTIPTQVTALGFIQLVADMKLEDNFIPLIIPAIAAPATFFYMKQYMESALPLSLVEAARIDGSGEFRTFNSIVLPLMKPAIAVQAIFTFVANWNNYFTPALVLHDDKMKTLPILIAQLRSADFLKFDMGQVYVTIAFSIFPVIIVYLFLSKYIVQGVAMGSVKG